MKKIFLIILLSLFLFPLIASATCTGRSVIDNQDQGNCQSEPTHRQWRSCDCTCICTGSYRIGCVVGNINDCSGAAVGGTTGGGTTGGGTTGGGTTGGGTTGGGSETTIVNPLTTNSFDEIINNVTDFLFKVALVVGPLMIVIAGFMLMTAADDTGKVTKAKQIIFYTLIGLFIVLFARGLVSVLKQVIGVKK